jgi:hypothetical protein
MACAPGTSATCAGCGSRRCEDPVSAAHAVFVRPSVLVAAVGDEAGVVIPDGTFSQGPHHWRRRQEGLGRLTPLDEEITITTAADQAAPDGMGRPAPSSPNWLQFVRQTRPQAAQCRSVADRMPPVLGQRRPGIPRSARADRSTTGRGAGQ